MNSSSETPAVEHVSMQNVAVSPAVEGFRFALNSLLQQRNGPQVFCKYCSAHTHFVAENLPTQEECAAELVGIFVQLSRRQQNKYRQQIDALIRQCRSTH